MASRLRLQPVAPGAVAWTEAPSRQNFQLAAALVTAGEPLKSRLLHPLAAEAGGDPAHTGGKFWESQNDPEWQTLAAWVQGASGTGASSGATAVQSTLATRDPFWMTFTPDSKFVYVANDASASVSAIDTQSMKEVARIPVGQVPKRNITAMLP